MIRAPRRLSAIVCAGARAAPSIACQDGVNCLRVPGGSHAFAHLAIAQATRPARHGAKKQSRAAFWRQHQQYQIDRFTIYGTERHGRLEASKDAEGVVDALDDCMRDCDAPSGTERRRIGTYLRRFVHHTFFNACRV